MLKERILVCAVCLATAGLMVWVRTEANSLERSVEVGKMPSMQELNATVNWQILPDETPDMPF